MIHMASPNFPDDDKNIGKIRHGRLGPEKSHVNLTLFNDSQSRAASTFAPISLSTSIRLNGAKPVPVPVA